MGCDPSYRVSVGFRFNDSVVERSGGGVVFVGATVLKDEAV